MMSLRRKTENSCHVGVQRDRSFYGDLHERVLIMLVICVELDKIPLLHKLKQPYLWVLIAITYTANNLLCKSYSLFSSIQNDHVMKTLQKNSMF